MPHGIRVGRLVHFIPGSWGTAWQPERHIPAVVTLVSDRDLGVCNLRLFADCSNDFPDWEHYQWAVSVPYDPSCAESYSWHYPED